MCGIAGIIHSTPNKYNFLMKKIVSSLSHRGPDSEGIEVCDGAIFGHSRLSIIDVENGYQPMFTRDKKTMIAFNGEIYGYKDIRSKLSHEFSTQSDTEVILAMYEKYGDSIFSKLPGMFSIALWDSKKKTLLLGRDRFGEKPLFYAIAKTGEIIFASELKAILTSKLLIPKLSRFAVASYLKNLYIPPDITIFENIHVVRPGHYVVFKNQKVQIEKYYHFPPMVEIDPDHAVDIFRERLRSSIEKQLISDVPVGAFLSGGIDSSLLAYIIKTKLNKKVRHFSLSFENKSYDEKNNILQISKTLSLESKIFTFNEHNTDIYVSDAISNMNSLILDYSFVPTYLLSKETSKYTKAVLSGDGADELFGGYEWYRGYLYYTKTPYKIKFTISEIIKKLNLTSKNNRYLSFAAKLNYFFKFISADPLSQTIIWQSSYQNFDKRKIKIISNEVSKYIDSELNNLENLRKIDLNIFMYTNVLPKVDIASMANSLEVRPPYLDDRIVEFALNTKNSNQISMLKTKIFLRDILKETNLEFLNKSRKQGFGFPLSSWIKNHGIEKIRQLYADENLIYPTNQEAYIKDLIFKKDLNPNILRELWSYFVLSTWCLDNNIKLK